MKDKTDGVLLISLVTIVTGFFIICIKLIFKSKCKDVNLCYGMIKVERNVELEIDIPVDSIPNQV